MRNVIAVDFGRDSVRTILLKAETRAEIYSSNLYYPRRQKGTDLTLKETFENNPNAVFLLWKDYTSVKLAEEINTCAKNSLLTVSINNSLLK
jgi:ribulose kinase